MKISARKVRGFEDLSPESQRFLIEYDINIEGDYADLFYSLYLVALYRAIYTFPSLDVQVRTIAHSQSIEVGMLDDNKKFNEELQSQTVSTKPVLPVDRNTIEGTIGQIEELKTMYRRSIVNMSQIYKMYDVNQFQVVREDEGENESEKVYFKNRNELWLQKFIEAHGKYESIFIAVGLKHLVGSYNILDMLAAEGFSIERMACLNK